MSDSGASGGLSGSGLAAVFADLNRKYGWSFDRLIGEGGFAYVYRERFGLLDRAVKISKSPVSEPDQRRDVQREFEVLRRSQGHPRLLALIHHEFVREHLVTVWELATGTLEAELREHRQVTGERGLPCEPLLRWMREAAEGIDFLNLNHRIYHRDIKPHNLFLLHGHLKVGDLGLAKGLDQSTASNTGKGTFGYLPPESLRNELHPSIDVYALAATYVRLRTGRPPFGSSIGEIVARGKHGEFETDGLSEAECAVLNDALSPDPDRRLASAHELVERLSAALTGQGAPPVKAARVVSTSAVRPDRETTDPSPASTVTQPAPSEDPLSAEVDAAHTAHRVRESVVYLLAVVTLIGLLGLLHHWSGVRAASRHGPSQQNLAASTAEAAATPRQPGRDAATGSLDAGTRSAARDASKPNTPPQAESRGTRSPQGMPTDATAR